MTPHVSIVVPVYNVEAYLKECLESILAQTFADIEIICVDDCSKDGSSAILESCLTKDPRVRVVRHDRNSGLSAARNTGIEAARGEWVLFVDSDDVVSKSLCQRSLSAAAATGADVVFYGHAAFQDGYPPPPEPAPGKPIAVDRRTLLERQAFAWTKLVRRELLMDKNIRFPVGLCFEDVPVHWRLALESTKPVLLDEAHVGYRQRAGSITYRKDWTRADGLKIYDLVAMQLRDSGNWGRFADQFRLAEMGNFAATYAYFELANRELLPRVIAESSARMTGRHVELALAGHGLRGWPRSTVIALFSPPSKVGIPCWLFHRARILVRSLARRAVHFLRAQ